MKEQTLDLNQANGSFRGYQNRLTGTLQLMTWADCLELLEDEDALTSASIQSEVLEGLELFRKDISRFRMTSCRLHNSHFEKVQFADVYFDSCDFSGATLTDCTFHNVTFHNCKLAGTRMIESYCKNSVFSGVQGIYANASSAEFISCDFRESVFAEASFAQAKFRVCRFDQTDFSRADFSRAAIGGHDFSTCSITGTLFSLDGLKNVSVTAEQAASLAVLLGIRIV